MTSHFVIRKTLNPLLDYKIKRKNTETIQDKVFQFYNEINNLPKDQQLKISTNILFNAHLINTLNMYRVHFLLFLIDRK